MSLTSDLLIHESAHAVVAARLGVHVVSITVESTAAMLGEVVWDRASLADDVAILLAGSIANPDGIYAAGSTFDLAEVEKRIQAQYGNVQVEKTAIYRNALATAEALVCGNLDQIRAAAKYLFANRTVCGTALLQSCGLTNPRAADDDSELLEVGPYRGWTLRQRDKASEISEAAHNRRADERFTMAQLAAAANGRSIYFRDVQPRVFTAEERRAAFNHSLAHTQIETARRQMRDGSIEVRIVNLERSKRKRDADRLHAEIMAEVYPELGARKSWT